MAEISQITLPSGAVYDIKDAWARGQISAITGGSALVFKGVSKQTVIDGETYGVLIDGGIQDPVVNGTRVTEKITGDIYFYNNMEYIWGPNPNYIAGSNLPQSVWHELGSTSILGVLATKNSASAVYQPQGTVTATLTTSTLNMSTSYTPEGTISFSSSSKGYGVHTTTTGTTSFTPEGSVGTPTFTGTTTEILVTGTYTPTGSISFTDTSSINVIFTSTAGTTTTIGSVEAIQSVTSSLITADPNSNITGDNTTTVTYCSVFDENLSLYKIGYSTAYPITMSQVNVKTSDPQYTGVVSIPSSPTFTGNATTITASTEYQPQGTNSKPTWTGNPVYLVTDNITTPASYTTDLSGTPATISVSGQPNVSINSITFEGTTTTITVS